MITEPEETIAIEAYVASSKKGDIFNNNVSHLNIILAYRPIGQGSLLAPDKVSDARSGPALNRGHPEESDACVYQHLIVLAKRADTYVCEVTIVPKPSKWYPMAVSSRPALRSHLVGIRWHIATSRLSQIRC